MRKNVWILLTTAILLLPVLVSCAQGTGSETTTAHRHAYGSEWLFDSEGHWHECACGEKADEAVHTLVETVTAATCETAGSKVSACSCGYSKTENFPALGHDYVQDSVTAPTASSEGAITLSCSRTGCDSVISGKILMLPTLTLTSDTLSWDAVQGAAGYILYSAAEQKDVGNVTSCKLSVLTEVGDTVAIRAYPSQNSTEYTDNDTYRSVYTFRNTGENTQAFLNADFELNPSEFLVSNNNGWSLYPYGNWSQAPYYILQEENGNMCAKIPATVWYPGSTKLQKDLSNAVCAAGTYRLSFDVKLSAAAMNSFSTDSSGSRYGHINVGLWTGLETYLLLDDSRNNLLSANTETWTTFTYDYTLDQNYGSFMHLCITYWPEVTLLSNYILVDNIRIQKTEGGEAVGGNLDTIVGGNFEKWGMSNTHPDTDNWFASGTILLEQSALGSELISESDGNNALKIYGEGEDAVFNLAGNRAVLSKAGLYEMTLRLKKGTALENPDFGFTMWSWANGGEAFQLTDNVVIDIGDANDSEYTVYRVRFISKGMDECDRVNICFWVKLQNEAKNADKYIIVDDVNIYPLGIEEKETMNILMIGNSFMDDTIQYVCNIAENAGYDRNLHLYGLFIGGCTLDSHWENFSNETRSYDLRKWNPETKVWNTVSAVSIQQALALQSDWDYISFQSSSAQSGLAQYFSHLKELTDGVRKIVGETTGFIWLGTWAYTKDFGTAVLQQDMAPYNMDQMTMYDAIQEQIIRITETENIYPFVKMVPSGTAVQNMRTAYEDTVISRDERHLSFGIGRFTSSMTFAATILGIDISQVTYRPSSVTYDQLQDVIQAVTAALENPHQVTSLAD